MRLWVRRVLSALVANAVLAAYTWDIPKASAHWNNAFTRGLLDNWQLSGLTTLAFTTTDNADITGGGDVTRWAGGPGASAPPGAVAPGIPVLLTDPNLSSADRGLVGRFSPAAFGRPARGDAGNTPKDAVRGPGIDSTDVTLFKNIPLGSSGLRRLQLRWEIYNVFNHIEFATVDAVARFDAAGNQVNTRFGQVITTRAPRVMQVALRFVGRIGRSRTLEREGLRRASVGSRGWCG